MANVLSIQINSVIGECDKNLEKVKTIIEVNANKHLDLIVMPEFFNTGIQRAAFEQCAQCEKNNSVVTFFSKLAEKYNCYILCGSIVEKDGNKLSNCAILLDRKGKVIARYRKKNLFKYFGGTEDEYITAGNDFVVVDTELGKIGLATCFDISYPLHFAQLAKMGAEIILCPAAWCTLSDKKSMKIALESWNAYNKVRAIDNNVYFVSANMSGDIDACLTCVGNSSITAYDGELLANAGDGEGAAFAKIDIEKLRKYRKIAPTKF